ncbi:MAG TPA: hypothetical protein VL974_03370 [Magnetospirillum sp.]|jgi:hypothetical protein|nr:hypothetical protein [Magnetospirillum sp.]
MVVTNIRIEAPSNRPSALQNMVQGLATLGDMAGFGLSLMAPYRFVLMLYGVNRAVTRAMFMV